MIPSANMGQHRLQLQWDHGPGQGPCQQLAFLVNTQTTHIRMALAVVWPTDTNKATYVAQTPGFPCDLRWQHGPRTSTQILAAVAPRTQTCCWDLDVTNAPGSNAGHLDCRGPSRSRVSDTNLGPGGPPDLWHLLVLQ